MISCTKKLAFHFGTSFEIFFYNFHLFMNIFQSKTHFSYLFKHTEASAAVRLDFTEIDFEKKKVPTVTKNPTITRAPTKITSASNSSSSGK